jgi:multiple sugar transport system permease protein
MFIFGLFQVPIMLGLALAFALLLDAGSARFNTLFRLGYFLPYAIPSVAAALLWGYLYGKNLGLFAYIANWAHLPAPDFLSNSGMLPSLANIVTWQWTGYNMVIIYAALTAISPDLYDAATVDGANGRGWPAISNSHWCCRRSCSRPSSRSSVPCSSSMSRRS